MSRTLPARCNPINWLCNLFRSSTLAVWGFATAAALALLGSDIPIVRADVLGRIPFAGKYFPVQVAKGEEED